MKMILTEIQTQTNPFPSRGMSRVYIDMLTDIHKNMTVVESRDAHNDGIKYITFEGQYCGKKVFVDDLHAFKNPKDENKCESHIVNGDLIYTFTFEEVLVTSDYGTAGYHKTEIKKGVNGEISKIQEELDELKDAEQQDIKVMQLAELSDLVGAIEMYIENKFPDISLEDLIKMKDATKRAFQSGRRS